MGVTVKKHGSNSYVYVNHHGRRKNRCVGTREAAEKVRRELEARLALGDTSLVLQAEKDQRPKFDAYADHWLKHYARIECKTSTVHGYEGVLNQYLRPRFGSKRLDEIC